MAMGAERDGAPGLDQGGPPGPAPLFGLVLVGGRSERMRGDGSVLGTDTALAGKGALAYHGRPQAAHVFDLLSAHCRSVFLSCRADQAGEPAYAGLPQIHDTHSGLGPLAGILAALEAHPEAAWLVAACDLPYLDAAAVEALAAGRDPSAFATAFEGPIPARSGHRHRDATQEGGARALAGKPGAPEAADAGSPAADPAGSARPAGTDPDEPAEESLGPNGRLPEPLFAIFEPRMGARIRALMSRGVDCPRKAILRSRSRILPAPDPRFLLNVNDPGEYRRALEDFARRRS